MAGELWSWLGAPLPLDFAATVRRVGATEHELWLTGDDVREWSLRERGRVPAVSAAEAEERLDELRAARDDVLAVMGALTDGVPLPVAACRRINARARAHPVVSQLPVGDRPATARSVEHGSPVDELIGRAMHAFIGFVASPEVERLTLCDAPGCGQFYLRDRPDQQWCGVSCGNRARVARHQARRRAAAGAPPSRQAPAARRRAR
jgi:predicted RNA-binding Zn ribbon-like protein